jgi:hypothetical protein
LKADAVLPLEPAGRLFHIQAELSIPQGAKLTCNIRGVPVVLASTKIECGNYRGEIPEEIKSVEILVDRASIEAFVNRGEISLTRFVLPKGNGLSAKAEGGSIKIHWLVVWHLNSAWAEGTAD